MQELVGHAAQRFSFRKAVEVLGPVGPEHDAVVRVAHQYRRQLQQGRLLPQLSLGFFTLGDVLEGKGGCGLRGVHGFGASLGRLRRESRGVLRHMRQGFRGRLAPVASV